MSCNSFVSKITATNQKKTRKSGAENLPRWEKHISRPKS